MTNNETKLRKSPFSCFFFFPSECRKTAAEDRREDRCSEEEEKKTNFIHSQDY